METQTQKRIELSSDDPELRRLFEKNSLTSNEAGGLAYRYTREHALAQLAATGCLGDTFYPTKESPEQQIIGLARGVASENPELVAKIAICAHQTGHMKDVPALLLAVLHEREEHALLGAVFDKVITTGRMLRNFVKHVRSGKLQRKSFGRFTKTLIQKWLAARSPAQLFRASVGNNPSIADIIKMVHPKPVTAAERALYGYLIGSPHASSTDLPKVIRDYEVFRHSQPGKREFPEELEFRLLTGLNLTRLEWCELARKMPWQALRQSLVTLQRQGVFESAALTDLLATHLRDPAQIKRTNVMPYQLMATYKALSGLASDKKPPQSIFTALNYAMEVAVDNTPQLSGRVVVCPDVSGSMQSAITGERGSATSKVKCVGVAALVAACIARHNKDATVIPFDTETHEAELDQSASIIETAEKLASFGGGGTDCAAPLHKLNSENAVADIVIFISDCESWVELNQGQINHFGWQRGYRNTTMQEEWHEFKKRCPNAKLVCIDLQPYTTVQVPPQQDVLLVGGFSDAVFEVINTFASGQLGGDHWLAMLEGITI